MVILIFLINLRVMIPGKGSEVVSNDLDVLFVIDTTISMNALDYNNDTRLKAVKEDCKYIIEQLDGARFSVVTFDNNAKVLVPFTYDANISLEAIELINIIDELYARGTSLNIPIETLEKFLTPKNTSNEVRAKVIFFISDGEITNDDKLKSYKKIGKFINNGAVLGYGTEKGGYMKYKLSYSDEEKYIMDYTNGKYEKAVSKMDSKNLKKIAKDLKVEYIKMNNKTDIDKKLKEIKSKTNNKVISNDKSTYNDIYYLLIFPLLILMVIDFIKVRSRII